ncbi:MAG: NAD(P)-binding domain-containing protein [Fodinibius sp.]|nr:NAD(P)-binding domain-containing protein [Fodinibius sp.]
MSLPDTSIIGTGALGSALCRALVDRQFPVKSIFNRDRSLADQLADELGVEYSAAFPQSVEELGSITFLTVSDGAISEVAARISQLSDSFEGYTFVHCSGNESADLLDSLRAKGASVASFHPLQTFNSRSGPEDFRDIYFSIQGDREGDSGARKIWRNGWVLIPWK